MSRYLGSKMILEENWERYRRHWSSEENKVDDLRDDKGGWIGAMGALDGPWWWWPAIAAEEDDPFLFFDDSAIWWSFSEFLSVESKEEWKWWRLGFTGRVLVKNWGRYEGLKIGDEGGTKKIWFEDMTCFEEDMRVWRLIFVSIYRGGRDVIDYKVW